jgi:hypothetical protein
MFDVAEARLNKAVRTLPADQRLYLMRREPLDIEPSAKLLVESIDFRTACSFVNSYHSHHGSPVGHVFSLGVNAGEDLVAVAIVGRPNARLLDDGRTLEITRVASAGIKNACSMLLAACRREAKLRGHTSVITYTLEEEHGVSLRAAGFTEDGVTGGGKWSRAERPREYEKNTGAKRRWRGS